MTRLTWNNVTAPDLARTSQIIHSAGESFQDGLTRASEILSEYDLGQKEKNDQALLSEVAALKSEEELANFLKSDRLTGLNISPEMRKSILGLRQNILNADQTRANTGLTRANIGLTNANIDQTRANIGLINANIGLRGAQTDQTRANIRLTNANTADVLGRLGLARSADARTQADWESKNRAEAELDSLTPYVVDAIIDGRANGSSNGLANGSGNMAEIEAAGRAGNFSTQASMLQAAVIKQESGGDPEIVSPVGATGIMQLMPETAMDPGYGVRNIFEHARSLGVPISGETAEVAEYLMRNPQVNAQMGHEYLTAMLRRYNGDVVRALAAYNWGPTRVDTWDGNIASLPKETRGYLRNIIGSVSGGGQPSSNNSFNNLADVIRGSVYISPDEAEVLLQKAYDAETEGQKRIDARKLAEAKERQAAAILKGVSDASIISINDLTDFFINDAGLQSNTEILDVIEDVQPLVTEGGALSTRLTPPTEPDTLVNSTVETRRREINRKFNARPATRMLELAGGFKDGDVAENLMAHLELYNDKENPRTYVFSLFGENADENLIRNHINSIAKRAGVTPEIAAAAMAEVFVRDPWWLNTVDRRFKEEKVIEVIDKYLNSEALRDQDDLRIQNEVFNKEFESALLQFNTLSQVANKHLEQGQEVPTDLTYQIETLRTFLINGVTPEQARSQLQRYLNKTGMAARFVYLDPNSEEYIREIKQLEFDIRGDPSLTDDEKSILLAAIQG